MLSALLGWFELRKRETLQVVILFDPLSISDKIALHATGERDRPSKAKRAEPKKIEEKRSKRSFRFTAFQG